MGTVPLITSMSDSRNLLTIAMLVFIALLGLYSISGNEKIHKSTLFSLALILFPYIPASNLFFPVGFVVAERVLYVPSMGYCMLVALGVWILWRKGNLCNVFVKAGLFWLILTHSGKTLLRNKDWNSDVSLFSAAIHINPQNGKIYNNLGHEYERMGDYSQAEQLFRTAAAIQSDDIGAFINLGRVLKAQERYEEAESVS